MNRVNKVAAAFALAKSVHGEQKDKAGEPYMEHVRYVAAVVGKHYDYGSDEHIVAILHDVLEDSKTPGVHAGEIYRLFGHEILVAVLSITKRKGEAYFAYIMRVRENRITRRVKPFDIGHNMQTDRITKIRPLTAKEEEKQNMYRIALEILHSDR